MRLGAHVATSGGVDKAVDRAVEMGAEAIQIFASSPRAWAFRELPDDKVETFHENAESAGVLPVFVHGSYLVNVGGSADILGKSINSLVEHMNAADRLGASGVIFHGGSHKGMGFEAVLGQAADSLKQVLSESQSDVSLVIENSAGMGSHIGASFSEIASLMNAINDTRVKVCLDTQHLFAAGYNVGSVDGIEKVIQEFDDKIGISNLVAIHANDSKVELGAGVDRHENIGQGHIGLSGFETIMAHQALSKIPFILEVPGFDKKGPDKENLDRLKDIRTRLGISE